MTTAPEMVPGLRFPDWTFAVSADEQAENLACCGVDPKLYAGDLDITHLAGATILQTRRAGFSINGSVHVGHSFQLMAPIPLETEITLSGRVETVRQVPRGEEVSSQFEVRLPDGSVPLRMQRLSLCLVPERSESPEAPRQSRAAPADELPADAIVLRRHQLQPERVAAYSVEAENLIHSDPAVAAQFGFRAPIAGGLMAVRLIMACLREHGRLQQLTMSVRFRRPMFWDEALTVMGRLDPLHASGDVVVVKPDGKAAVTGTVPEARFGA